MLNRSILMGRLTSDPELKQTPNGIFVTSFSIAVNRNYNRDITDFINIVAWRNTAEFICRYFKKGQLVALEGSIQTRNYEDKTGNKRTAFEVVADQVYFAESKNSNISNTQSFSMPSIQTRNYEDKTGNKRTAFEVVADQVYFAESKNSNISNTQSFSMPSISNQDSSFNSSASSSFSSGDFDGFEELEVDDDELPF